MGICSTCLQPFTPKRKNLRHCSTRCSEAMRGRKPRRKTKTTTKAGRGYDYRKIRPQILQRDAWTCLMPVCKAPTRNIWRDAPRGHPWSASVDHIIRPCDGGHHSDPANLRASHLGCNSSAGAVAGNRARVQRYTSSAPRIAR